MFVVVGEVIYDPVSTALLKSVASRWPFPWLSLPHRHRRCPSSSPALSTACSSVSQVRTPKYGGHGRIVVDLSDAPDDLLTDILIMGGLASYDRTEAQDGNVLAAVGEPLASLVISQAPGTQTTDICSSAAP